MSAPTPPDPVSVWFDREAGALMSDLGSVDNTCLARVHSGHCPDRHQCVVLDRAPASIVAAALVEVAGDVDLGSHIDSAWDAARLG